MHELAKEAMRSADAYSYVLTHTECGERADKGKKRKSIQGET